MDNVDQVNEVRISVYIAVFVLCVYSKIIRSQLDSAVPCVSSAHLTTLHNSAGNWVKGRPLHGIGSKSEIKKCVTFWDFLAEEVTPWRTLVQIYFHHVHMARQTRTFFLSNHNLFSDSNYETPHYAVFPNPAYVLRLKSTYSPQDSQFVFPGYAFFERKVSTRGPGASFCRTRNSSSTFYSICCYNYLNYIISIVRVHISRSLIAISAIATKWLDGSEEFPFAQTTNHL